MFQQRWAQTPRLPTHGNKGGRPEPLGSKFSIKKREYAIISFAFWSPKTAAKSLQTTLAATSKNPELIKEFAFLADFDEGITCDQKRNYAIISFALWSPKTAAKSLQTTLEATRKIKF